MNDEQLSLSKRLHECAQWGKLPYGDREVLTYDGPLIDLSLKTNAAYLIIVAMEAHRATKVGGIDPEIILVGRTWEFYIPCEPGDGTTAWVSHECIGNADLGTLAAKVLLDLWEDTDDAD